MADIRVQPHFTRQGYSGQPPCTQSHNHAQPRFLLQGDNDPVDVVEIGSAVGKMGGVYKVKPLGVYAMIDDGELDWKVIAIRADDPKAGQVNDVEDVERWVGGISLSLSARVSVSLSVCLFASVCVCQCVCGGGQSVRRVMSRSVMAQATRLVIESYTFV